MNSGRASEGSALIKSEQLKTVGICEAIDLNPFTQCSVPISVNVNVGSVRMEHTYN